MNAQTQIETTKKYVAYYRVSTKKQGQSGLGLDAQKQAVLSFTKCSECIINEFVEIESGKKNNRAELQKAIDYAKMNNATLVVAKLDRLSRNVEFTAALMNSKVDFVCTDMPNANSLTIHIIAAIAQNEREMISKRTKDALAVKKNQGTKLGSPVATETIKQYQSKGIAVIKEKAQSNNNNKRAAAMVKSLRTAGKTWNEVVNTLNASGFVTSKGCKFTTTQAVRLMKFEI